jgi:predicted ATPase with chaperone activity
VRDRWPSRWSACRAIPVEIEADIENGLVALLLVGLPDTALREARDRIRSAIINSYEAWSYRSNC